VGKSALAESVAGRFPGKVLRVEIGERAPEEALAIAAGVPLGPPELLERTLGLLEGLVVIDETDAVEPDSLLNRWKSSKAALLWVGRAAPALADTITFALKPLSLPPKDTQSLEKLCQAPAGALLYQQAQRVRTGLVDADAPALAALTWALEGLPPKPAPPRPQPSSRHC
jgi:hypothetical protein